ncbi:hypothetical protein [Agreia sp.]|uniref:hypothetical protein n=1 Tax=Agreia sp. TaxID=1872416 RepID=UPI0035BC3AFF
MNDDVPAVDAQRRELQRRVFSAASDATDARVAARQLQQLDERRQQSAAESARRAATALEPHPQPSASATGPQGEGEARSLDAPVVTAVIASVADLAPTPFTFARFAAAVLLALAVGLAAGVSAASRPVAVLQTAPPAVVVDTSGALALFERPQIDADIPVQSLPATVIRESIRAMGDPFFELYIGRNAANMVCLFAVQPADSFSMSCVTIDEFPSTGIRLEWSGEMSSISADGTTRVVPSTMKAIWRPDGTLDLGGGPR